MTNVRVLDKDKLLKWLDRNGWDEAYIEDTQFKKGSVNIVLNKEVIETGEVRRAIKSGVFDLRERGRQKK